jgi:hypothetical protein
MRRLISKLNLGAAVAALALVVFGCRHADVNRELVERELRLQEDELYRLHDEIADREKLLEAARRENTVLERELEQARAGAAVPPGIIPSLPPAPTDPPPDRAPRPDSGVPPIDVAPPIIKVPGLEGPLPSAPPPGRSSWKSTRGVRPASYEQPTDEPGDRRMEAHRETSKVKPRSEPNDHQIAKIVLNRRLTAGYNADRRLGDEGIVVVIEPRNEDDRIVSRPGDVSVVVVDPALSTEDARVARWDFTADEISQHFRKTTRGEGIHLELPWPARRPEHERLMLFVRFITADGEIHEASQPILLDLASDSTGHGAAEQ